MHTETPTLEGEEKRARALLVRQLSGIAASRAARGEQTDGVESLLAAAITVPDLFGLRGQSEHRPLAPRDEPDQRTSSV